MKPCWICWFTGCALVLPGTWGAAASPRPPLPPAAAATVDFTRDIKPILEASCIKCHAHGQRKGKFAIDSRAAFLAGGESGPAAREGQSAGSLVIELVAGHDPDRLMPAKGPRLTSEQIALLRAWIDQGLPWPEGVALGRGSRAPLAPRRVALPNSGKPANPIDQLLADYFAKHDFKPGRPVPDRVFARRAFLDVIGLLPEPEEVRAFEADRHPDKRARLVRRLLADNQRYAEHWMTFWNDALRNDYRGTGYIDGGRKQITPWLYAALATNMPFDRFVARLVNPDEHSDGFVRGIIWRGVVNASQTPQMQAAQNLSQVFLGLNLKCASCHDSFINDWKLSDAYGLASIYADEPLELVRCDTPTGERAQRKFLFPELGAPLDTTNRAERLASLAGLITSPQNGRLTRTVVNRIWAKFMGRGLIEPVDEMDNPPWNADLLDWLALDLAEHGYDLKHTMELILTSAAYQLPATAGEEQPSDRFVFRGPVVKRLTAEQYVDALSALTGAWRALPENPEIDFTLGRSEPQSLGPAQWIWGRAAGDQPPRAVWFRKRHHLPAIPAQAVAVITADNRFTLFVNGHQVASGQDWEKFKIIDLRPHLVIGDNVFAVAASNDEAPAGAAASPNPAGLLFYAWLRTPLRSGEEGDVLDVASDDSWQCSTAEQEGWQRPEFEPGTWSRAMTLGGPNVAPWHLGRKFAAAVSQAAQYGKVRAVFAASDPLMSALGRPNREQVVTARPTVATTIQAMELTNGSTLAEWLRRGAARLLGTGAAASARDLVVDLYRRGLGRDPTRDELETARLLVGTPVRREGVEDLLWAVSLLPEFQLIY